MPHYHAQTKGNLSQGLSTLHKQCSHQDQFLPTRERSFQAQAIVNPLQKEIYPTIPSRMALSPYGKITRAIVINIFVWHKVNGNSFSDTIG
jgi:hypothetical protein